MVTAPWCGVDVLRPIAWLYAAYSAFVRQQDMVRPWLAWVVLAVLGAWTVGMFLYRSRHKIVVGVELFVACAAILSTCLVDAPEVIAGGAKTVPRVLARRRGGGLGGPQALARGDARSAPGGFERGREGAGRGA